MAVHELILLLCEIARDKWCSYWEHDPGFVIKIYVIIVYSIYILGIFTTLQECTKNTPQNAPPQG